MLYRVHVEQFTSGCWQRKREVAQDVYNYGMVPALVWHLVATKPDHVPFLLTQFQQDKEDKGDKPFCFEAFSTEEDECRLPIKDA